MPISRERDTVTAETAETPIRRLHFCVQMMYLKDDVPRYRDLYRDLVEDLRKPNPQSGDLINSVDDHVSRGFGCKLKKIRKLMKCEQKLFSMSA